MEHSRYKTLEKALYKRVAPCGIPWLSFMLPFVLPMSKFYEARQPYEARQQALSNKVACDADLQLFKSLYPEADVNHELLSLPEVIVLQNLLEYAEMLDDNIIRAKNRTIKAKQIQALTQGGDSLISTERQAPCH